MTPPSRWQIRRAEVTVARVNPLRPLALYLLLVFGGGCLLAPWLYALVQSLNHEGLSAGLAQQPFYRYVHRCLLLVAVAGLSLLCRAFGIRNLREAGWSSPRNGVRALGWGLVVGFLTLAVPVAGALAFGAREFVPVASRLTLLSHVPSWIATALFVAILEELLFRGVLLGGLQRRWSRPAALCVSSAVYALVHFFAKPANPSEIVWWSGFTVLKDMVRGFVDPGQIFPGFFSLFIVGLILGRLFQTTRSLWPGMGLHAGWIFWLKSHGSISQETSQAAAILWGTHKLYDGWIPLLVILAAGVVIEKWARNHAVDGQRTFPVNGRALRP